MSQPLDIGIDLGTTMTKAGAFDSAGTLLAQAATPTTWRSPRPGWTERAAADLFEAVDELLAALAAQAAGATFRSVGFTGMAETGSVVRDGRTLTPLIAWYDPRGGAELDRTPASFRSAFPARSGLPVTSLASIAKILWLREQGTELEGAQWLSVPELVCLHLGADPVAELSMIGRTGLLDVHASAVSAQALSVIGAGADFVPPLRPAGAFLGRVRSDHPVAALRGAALTVAGHDHLVAAAAAGAAAPGTVFDSFGTAEAFVAATSSVPSPDQVAHLVSLGMNVYPHVVSGTTCVLAGAKSGIVLSRVLRLLGITTPEARRELDEAASATAVLGAPIRTDGVGEADGIQVCGAHMDDHEVTITIEGDDCSPQTLWAAALGCGTSTAAGTLAGMRHGGLDVDELVLAGGWSRMSSVVRARQSLGVPLRLAEMSQPGLVGAARMGAWAAAHETEHPTSPPAGWFAPTTVS
jgi:sugar (pentulose or hexulose) kinase